MCPPTRPPLSVVFSKRFSDWHLTGVKTDFTLILTPESETLSFRHRSHCSLALHWFCIRFKNLVQFLKSGNSPSAPGSQCPFVQGAVKPGDLKKENHEHFTEQPTSMTILRQGPKGDSRASCCRPHSTGTCRWSSLGRAHPRAESTGDKSQFILDQAQIRTLEHSPDPWVSWTPSSWVGWRWTPRWRYTRKWTLRSRCPEPPSLRTAERWRPCDIVIFPTTHLKCRSSSVSIAHLGFSVSDSLCAVQSNL